MKTILKSGLVLLLLSAVATRSQIVTAIASGSGADHSIFLESDGSLWTMGANQYGQLGDGSFNNTNLPQFITSGVRAISGNSHTLFVKTNGSLWGMGWNYQGQLGDGSNLTTAPYAPISLNKSFPAASPILRRATSTASFSNPMAACGRWVLT